MNRLARLRAFAASADDWRAGLDQVAAELCESPLSGSVAFVLTGTENRLLLLDLDQPLARDVMAARDREATAPNLTADAGSADPRPDFVIYIDDGALGAILCGELSPLEALFRGHLRYAGSEELGLNIMRQLAAAGDAVFEPCRDERW
jgi:hypothetical protein